MTEGISPEVKLRQLAFPECAVATSDGPAGRRCGRLAEWFSPTGAFWICRQCFYGYAPEFRMACQHISTVASVDLLGELVDTELVTHDEASDCIQGMAHASGWFAVERKLRRYIHQQSSRERELQLSLADTARAVQDARDVIGQLVGTGRAGGGTASLPQLLLMLRAEWTEQQSTVTELKDVFGQIADAVNVECKDLEPRDLLQLVVALETERDSLRTELGSPSEPTIRWRGSITDLATDIAHELSMSEGVDLLRALGRMLNTAPNKFRAGVADPSGGSLGLTFDVAREEACLNRDKPPPAIAESAAPLKASHFTDPTHLTNACYDERSELPLGAILADAESLRDAPTAESKCEDCNGSGWAGPNKRCDCGAVPTYPDPSTSDPAPVAEAPELGPDEVEHEGRIAMSWSEIIANGEPRPFRAFRMGYHTARRALERHDPHHYGMGAGDEDGYNMVLAEGGGTHRDVRNYLHRLDPKRLGSTITETLLAYVDKAEQQESRLTDANLKAEGLRVEHELFSDYRRGALVIRRALEAKLAESERKLGEAGYCVRCYHRACVCATGSAPAEPTPPEGPAEAVANPACAIYVTHQQTWVTRAELIVALRHTGAHGVAGYALEQVARRLEKGRA